VALVVVERVALAQVAAVLVAIELQRLLIE
jgi:hypothetical protein